MPTLTWIGKEKVVNHHHDVPFRVLRHEYTFRPQTEVTNTTDNRIIHGDNLEALKSLLPEFEGRVKCIYIDPPYNTGNEGWIYNDNVNDPQIKKWLGQVVGKEGEDLSRHDKWLCMMYPRLKLLQKLLADDGVIFISIGEDEQASLKLLCDEIFGSQNYVTNFGRQMKSGGAKGKYYTPNIDYILTYAQKKDKLPFFRAVMTQSQIDVFYKYTEQSGPRKGEIYGEERLFKASLDPRPNQRYYIQCPDGTFAIPPGENFPEELREGVTVLPRGKDKVWKWIYPRYQKELAEGNIIFKRTKTSGLIDEHGNKSNWNIYNKLWLNEQQEKGVVPSNLILGFENRQSAAEMKNIELDFQYAKPIRLIEYLLTISNQPNDALILDSFAGSGTTAHAVLNMNKADGGHRKFILVEMMDYAESITAERVRRVMDGYGEGDKPVEGLGGSLDFYSVGEPLFLTDELLNEAVGLKAIREYVAYSEGIPVEERVELGDPRLNAISPHLLGINSDTAWIFNYETEKSTSLDMDFLSTLRFDGNKPAAFIIYADRCLLSKAFMDKHGIIFKKIPRDITRF